MLLLAMVRVMLEATWPSAAFGVIAFWLISQGPRAPANLGWEILAPIGHFLIFVKLEDHDIRAPILGMGHEVAIKRDIGSLFKTTTNRHDLPRTVQFSPLFNLINGL